MTALELITAGWKAREYLRVSVDKSGRERSPEEQHDENVVAVRPYNLTLGKHYRDIGSASDFSEKTRVDFDRLIADLETGHFGAQILVVWAVSRASRRVREWLDLIDILAEHKIYLFVTTHKRLYDMANRHDRRSILEEAMKAEDQAHEISEGVSRANAANAAAGKPHGRVPYGYRRIYDPETRKFIRQEPHPDEAPVVRELFRRLEKGHSLRAIATDYGKRGLRTRPRENKKTGKIESRPWTPEGLRDMALSATYAGLRVHDPKRWKQGNKRLTVTPPSQIVKATWPALVPMARYRAVQRTLTDTTRRTFRDGRAKHQLSRIAYCGVCGAWLTSAEKGGGAAFYRCRAKGCVRCNRQELEDLAQTLILGYLVRKENYSAFVQANTVELDQVKAQLAEARKDWDDLANLSPALAGKMEPSILDRIAKLEAEEAELETPAELLSLLGAGKDMEKRWNDPATPITTKRLATRLLLSPAFLGSLILMPATEKAPRWSQPVAERVVLRRLVKGKLTDLRAAVL